MSREFHCDCFQQWGHIYNPHSRICWEQQITDLHAQLAQMTRELDEATCGEQLCVHDHSTQFWELRCNKAECALRDTQTTLAQQQAEVRKLREVLAKYAHPLNWVLVPTTSAIPRWRWLHIRSQYPGLEAQAILEEGKEKRAKIDVAQLVDRFLAWPLPDSVCADLCVTKQGSPHRSGTNLLSADEAKQMLDYLLGECLTAREGKEGG